MSLEINIDNCEIGNQAMAQVLLLYFHILAEKGITNDQTAYLDRDHFDPQALISVEVGDSVSMDIDQSLLREGAMIYWLCELNDVVGEYEDSFHSHPYFNMVQEQLKNQCASDFPELSDVLNSLACDESKVDFAQYQSSISLVVRKYVFERMQNLVGQFEVR